MEISSKVEGLLFQEQKMIVIREWVVLIRELKVPVIELVKSKCRCRCLLLLKKYQNIFPIWLCLRSTLNPKLSTLNLKSYILKHKLLKLVDHLLFPLLICLCKPKLFLLNHYIIFLLQNLNNFQNLLLLKQIKFIQFLINLPSQTQ